MFRKMLILGFICFLSLTFLGRVEANQYSLRVLDSRGSSENPIPVAGAHAHVGVNAGGQQVFNGDTDSQGFIWFDAYYLQHLFYEISKPPCYNTIIGQITAGVTQAVIMPWNGSCQSPQDTTITAKDGGYGPPYNTPVAGATVTSLPPDANCQNGCITDALGKVYFVLMQPSAFTISAAGFNVFNGTAQPGQGPANEVILQPIIGPINTWLTAWDKSTMTMLPGCHFVIKRCPTLETMYDCTYPNCSFVFSGGNWSFADGVATLKVYLPANANYVVSKWPGYNPAQNGCFPPNNPLQPGEHRDALLEPIPQGGGNCFLPGTPIQMANGSFKPIEKVLPGEMVLAFDEKTGKVMEDKVKTFFVHEADSYLEINHKIKVTGEHPFNVNGKWIPAKDLRQGDKLTTSSGKSEAITSIRPVKQKTLAYNLEVNPYHTYFAAGYLVHNKTQQSEYQQLKACCIDCYQQGGTPDYCDMLCGGCGIQ